MTLLIDHPSVELPSAPDPVPFDELRLLAESFDDLQRTRIAMEGRARSATMSLDPATASIVALARIEGQMKLALTKCFRRVAPEVCEWAVATPGVGEHTLARLLGVIGNPGWAWPSWYEGVEGENRKLVTGEPYARMVSQLWAYCGHGDPTRRKRKGMSAEDALGIGSPRAKMLTYLLSTSCMKAQGSSPAALATTAAYKIDLAALQTPSDTQKALGDGEVTTTIHDAHDAHGRVDGGSDGEDDGGEESEVGTTPTPPTASHRRRSPYRDVYEQARLKYATREGWTPGHQNAASLRYVGKMLLLDLWLVTNGKPTKHPYTEGEWA